MSTLITELDGQLLAFDTCCPRVRVQTSDGPAADLRSITADGRAWVHLDGAPLTSIVLVDLAQCRVLRGEPALRALQAGLAAHLASEAAAA